MKKKVLKLLFSLVFSLLGMSAIAQTTTVSGVVSDTQFPLPGVNIVVKGTTNGTTTDFDGNYALNDVGPEDILVFSYVGYKTQEITVGSQTTINVTMAEDAAALDEVVVVGYGTQSRRNVTGAIASIKAEDISKTVTGNPTAALQGKLAGVQVETFGGQPGGPANVFVRGVGSLTNSFPLYVIDGTFAENMDFINPNDISSIQVLKDASSAAIYGARASNGVVLISTKKGNRGDVSVNLNIRGGFETPSKRLDFLNSEQFLDYRSDLETNDASGFLIDRNDFTQNGQLTYTDWQDESFSSGAIQDYGISVSGGAEKSRYFFSTNYYQQDGILVGSGFKRLNARLNSQFEIGKFKIEESIGLSETKTQENEYFGFEASPSPLLRLNAPENDGGFEAPERATSGFGGLNDFALASLEDNLNTRRSLLGNVNVSYQIMEGLTAKINLGAEYINSFKQTFRPTYFMSTTDARFNDNPQNDLTHVRSEFLRTQVETTVNYEKEIGDHKFDVLAGYGQLRTQFDLLANYVGNLPSNDIRTTGVAGVANILGAEGLRTEDGLISIFGRVNYSFANKYLITATIRRDETSKFADGNRAGSFPSFSLGWRVSDEEFFPEDSFISELKIRGGYGELGAQNVGDYLYQSVVGSTSSVSFGNGIVPGFAQTSFVNEDLQWETSSTVNVGVDFGFLDNQLTLSTEYYKKDISDLLVAIPIPASNGTNVPVTRNAAGLENSGFEILLNYKNNDNDFKYNIGLNLATQKSTLTDVPTPFFGPSVNEGIQSVNIFRSGDDPGSFYGFVVNGVYDDQAQINSDPNRSNDPNISALSPGDFIRQDINGDNKIDSEDLTVLGSPVPDFTYGINFNGEYKNFDFSIFLNGVSGNEVYNQSRNFNTLGADGNKLSDVLDRWTPQNTTGSFPRPSAIDQGENRTPSSFFVEDGSFLRLQNLTVGYNLTETVNVDWINRVRVSLTGQNLFVITNYSGYDPDVASTNGARSNENDGFFGFRPTVNSITGRGIDIRAYPRATSVIFGLEIGF